LGILFNIKRNDEMTPGTAIKIMRQSKGYSLTEFSRIIKWPIDRLSMVEHNKKKIQRADVKRIYNKLTELPKKVDKRRHRMTELGERAHRWCVEHPVDKIEPLYIRALFTYVMHLRG